MIKNLFLKKKDKFDSQNGIRRPFYFLSLVLLLVSFNRTILRQGVSFQDSGWSTPQTIPGYAPDTWPPILIPDSNRTVHAFSTQWISLPGEDSIRAIVYNKWSLENGWSNPVDIAMSPLREARLTDAYLDKDGIFHLTFFGGDNTGADIYYTKAPAADAADSRSWSTPVIIGENAGDPEGSAIMEDDDGAIHVLFNGRQQGNGLYVVTSKDGGESWLNPTPMFFAQTDEPNISRLHVIKGKSGWYHAIWGVYNAQGQGRGIYYARSNNGVDWSEPVLLADSSDGLGTQTPAIFEYNDSLFVIYNPTPKIMMRRSTDDGSTWSDPTMLFARHVGVNGSISSVVDGNDELHLFFGQRITGSPDIHGMWQSIYKNDRWTEPAAIVKGPRVWDLEGLTSFDPYEAHAVVSQGDVILVTWITDPGERKNNGVFYSFATLNATESPVVPLPTVAIPNFTNTITRATPVPTATETITSTPMAIFDQNPQDQRSRNWILIGVFMVGALGLGYILFLRGRG
jgi:hypothetical protein